MLDPIRITVPALGGSLSAAHLMEGNTGGDVFERLRQSMKGLNLLAGAALLHYAPFRHAVEKAKAVEEKAVREKLLEGCEFLRINSNSHLQNFIAPLEYSVIVGAKCFMSFRQVVKNQSTVKRFKRLWR